MASKTFLLSEATFDGVAIESVKSASIEKTSTPTDLSADSSRTVNKVVVDEKTVIVSVTTMDGSQALRPGSCGELILKTVERSAGDGVTAGATITMTNAKVSSSDNTIETQGESALVISFIAYDPLADYETESTLIKYT